MRELLAPVDYALITGEQPPSTFPFLLLQAEVVVERMLGPAPLDHLPESALPAIKKALVLEIYHLDSIGGLQGACEGNVSLGKFSYSVQAETNLEIGPGVEEALQAAGLLYRGCVVL